MRFLAGLAASLALIGFVAVAAQPAQAERPYEVSADEIELICAAFHGGFAEDRGGNYGCALPEADILCEAVTESCDYLTTGNMPGPFQGDCEGVAGGKFATAAPDVYICEFGLGTLIVDCLEMDEKNPLCDVGAILSEVPVR
jgi:hypothetical protein